LALKFIHAATYHGFAIAALFAAPHGGYVMKRFDHVVEILDTAVNHQIIGAHGNFWRGTTLQQFIGLTVRGKTLLVPGNSANSNIIKALRGLAPFVSWWHVPSDRRRWICLRPTRSTRSSGSSIVSLRSTRSPRPMRPLAHS
jgi:hypothetical protein